MNFPVLLKTDPDVRSDEAIYYLVAANGLFQVRRTESYEAVTRVTGTVPGLCEQEEYVELDIPLLPRALVRRVLAFFRAVYERYSGEAIVILFYQPETRTYRVVAPPQQCSGDRYRQRFGARREHHRSAIHRYRQRVGTRREHGR